MATKTLAVKAVIATVFLENDSHIYIELTPDEAGVVDVHKVLHRAPGTNDFYAENDAANFAAAALLNVFKED